MVNCTRLESVILYGIQGFEPLHLRQANEMSLADGLRAAADNQNLQMGDFFVSGGIVKALFPQLKLGVYKL